MQEVVELLANIAANNIFPIVMCFVLLKMNSDSEERHKKETDKLSAIVEKNTLVTQELSDKIESFKGGN